jgi:uncharacterized protein YqeY
MGILEQINSDLVDAMKRKDTELTTTLRGLKSAVKYREIDKGSELTEQDVIEVLSSTAKKHRDSIEQYEKGARSDLADLEKRQLATAMEYLPQQLSADEIASLVDEVIAETGASGPSGFGTVMKTVMPKVKGRADGRMVKDIVTQKLS